MSNKNVLHEKGINKLFSGTKIACDSRYIDIFFSYLDKFEIQYEIIDENPDVAEYDKKEDKVLLSSPNGIFDTDIEMHEFLDLVGLLPDETVDAEFQGGVVPELNSFDHLKDGVRVIFKSGEEYYYIKDTLLQLPNYANSYEKQAFEFYDLTPHNVVSIYYENSLIYGKPIVSMSFQEAVKTGRKMRYNSNKNFKASFLSAQSAMDEALSLEREEKVQAFCADNMWEVLPE